MPVQLANIILVIAMLGAFYALVIRPQQRRAAEHRAMVARIREGDEIVTIGGIFGVVDAVGERLVVRTVDGSRFELAPQAVGDIVRQAATDLGPDTVPADEAGGPEGGDTA